MNYVGIDIGSTASKVVARGETQMEFVLPTGWNSKETTRIIQERLKEHNVDVLDETTKVVATGYGRIAVDFADYVIIMGYDEHTAGSEEAGSVASIGYVRSGIEKTLEEVPKERVINAVPFYTRVWEESGPNLSSRALGMKDAAEYVENEGIELAWDDETGQYYGKKVTDTVTLEIWQEDARSIRLKVDAIKEYGLAGVGAWRLGYEPSEIWDEMQLN